MAAKRMKTAYITGVGYLNHQQCFGSSIGGMQMLNRRLQFGKSLYSKNLYAHYGCVNAIEFSDDGEWLASGGDDKRVLIWNVDKALTGTHEPKVMKGEHHSNIFCLGFNSHTKLYSAGNDEQVILHDVKTGEILDVFLHDEAVYGLSVDPLNEDIFVSACDDGRVLMWDVRQALYSDTFVIAACTSAFHAVMHHPLEPHYLATANAKDGVCLWDIRRPKVSVTKYGSSNLSPSAMSVRFNYSGTHILALRRRLAPVLYDVVSGHTSVEFDHPEYYNSCTMKSCCFAGDRDQYVLSGSDDFKLYVWRLPDDLCSKKRVLVNRAHFVLRGHRSIVNQVRYNNAYGILASSGVEKIVKLWSSFPISHNEIKDDYISENDLSRKVYSHEEYINLVLESGQFMTHDYSHHSVHEDPRMMAFFDSLVQRDIEGWTSDSSDANLMTTNLMIGVGYEVQSSPASSNTSSLSSSDDTEDEDGDGAQDAALKSLHKSDATTTTTPFTSKQSNENKVDFSIDRISQLIALRRQETNRRDTLRGSRGILKYKTMLKRSFHRACKMREAGAGKFPDIAGQNIDSSIAQQTSNEGELVPELANKNKDKRKLLIKKRRKINSSALISSSSSDSDDSDQRGSNERADNAKLNCNSTQNNDILEKTENDSGINLDIPEDIVNGTHDLNRVESESEQINTTVESNLPNLPSSTGLCENSEINSSFVCFVSKNGKHQNRNYRKRSAEDVDDD